ncbi:ABC transporter ATP-binding protein [Haloferax namakaokahaiae]|uniref:Probable branched-chain amino acid transport ATP-binding protein LivG n=1 Tax=Haloferax namakaokahaiae TaxID=1748331 RepID=A0ABD5ZDG3_9EURY
MSLLYTDGLTKRFGLLTAVDDVDLRIERDEIHSVIGPNGAGKSTLFNLITGLLQPSEGRVYFKDEDITDLPPRQIVHRGISRSFQIADLFEGLTVRENLRIAAQSLDDDHDSFWKRADSLSGPAGTADAILEDIGLTDLAEARADELSHGDRRKLDIGLGVAVEPELFLLDEPTAGMGKEESVKTVRMIQRVSADRGITPVLIEHDLEIVMGISDQITVLSEGGILAHGPPEEIQNDPAVQKAYLGTRGEYA